MRLGHEFIVRATWNEYGQRWRVALILRLEEEQLNGGLIRQLHSLLCRGKRTGGQESWESQKNKESDQR